MIGRGDTEQITPQNNTQSMIKLNTQNIQQSQNELIQKILSSSIKFDKNVNNKIEFTEFTGAIKILSPDNKQIDEVQMKDIFSKIKPQLEAQIQEQIYNEIENNTKNTPKRGRRDF